MDTKFISNTFNNQVIVAVQDQLFEIFAKITGFDIKYTDSGKRSIISRSELGACNFPSYLLYFTLTSLSVLVCSFFHFQSGQEMAPQLDVCFSACLTQGVSPGRGFQFWGHFLLLQVATGCQAGLWGPPRVLGLGKSQGCYWGKMCHSRQNHRQLAYLPGASF